jgi:hypothetical protein
MGAAWPLGHAAPFSSSTSQVTIMLVCTVNTRIGWPWEYFGNGVGPVFGFLAVCFLIFVGFAALAASTGEDEHGSFFAGFVIWLVAGLLLQGLPHTDTGIQFIPLLPWCYSGWIARIISTVCWLTFLIGVLTAFSPSKEHWKGAVAAILVALGLNALLSFASPADVTAPIATDGRSSVITSCQEKIACWEAIQKERSETLEKLTSEKETLVARIKSLGCQTKKELMSHPVGCTLANELEQLSRQMAHFQTETGTIEATVERAQSVLRCIEREAMVKGHSDEEFSRLSQIDHELQEELRKMTGGPTLGSEVRTDKLLDEVFSQTNKP